LILVTWEQKPLTRMVCHLTDRLTERMLFYSYTDNLRAEELCIMVDS